MKCIYCKKINNHPSNRCFWKKFHKKQFLAQGEFQHINKTYTSKGELTLYTKSKQQIFNQEIRTEETKLLPTEKEKEEQEIIILDTTEEDVQFIKTRGGKEEHPLINSIRTETIQPSVTTCNVPDHQSLHRKLRICEDKLKMCEDKNKKLQEELHNWKKHYLKTHMELMDTKEKTQKVDLPLNIPANIPPTGIRINRVGQAKKF